MSFLIFRYLTNWSTILFVIWYLGNKQIKDNLPIELLVSVVYYGYLVIYVFYHILFKKESYDLLFLLGNLLFHYIPYRIVSNQSNMSRRSIIFFGFIFSIYILYLHFNHTNPFQIYFNDTKLE